MTEAMFPLKPRLSLTQPRKSAVLAILLSVSPFGSVACGDDGTSPDDSDVVPLAGSGGLGGAAASGGAPVSPEGGAGASVNSAAGAGGTAPDPMGSGGAGGTAGSAGNPATPSGGATAGGSGGGGVSGGTGGATGGATAEEPVGPEPDEATRMRCTGTDPIECHFGGEPGNYNVTVVLGGEQAGSTKVTAETNRVMLPVTETAAGETKRFTFGVNVRQPESQPIQDVPAGTPGLDVYFRGQDGKPPQLQSIGYAPAEAPLVVYVAGDSTVCDQSATAYAGWGQMLPQFFKYPAVISNYSDSGESSGSFLNSNSLFGAIEQRLKSDDYVLIQFGHNDKTVTASTFRDNLTRLVTRVEAKGAIPVLITPVSRAQFNGDSVSAQHINQTGANLPQIMKEVAEAEGVALVDMTARTTEWYNELGPNGWQEYHALGTDRTHPSPAGAEIAAGFLQQLLKDAEVSPLTDYLR